MTEQPAGAAGTPAGVIPYVDFHQGPRRVLTLHVTTANAMMAGKIPPIVSIDGRQYVVYWGSIGFEIPADRACHVSVHVEGEYITQAASVLITPAAGPMTLTYATDYLSGQGSLR